MMRFTESDEQLRRENIELKRQLRELSNPAVHDPHAHRPRQIWRPSPITIWSLLLGAGLLLAVAFLAGYIPRQRRQSLIVQQSRDQQQALPRVEFVRVSRSGKDSELQLPGNIQAITEAPVLARAEGYVQKRMADLGDRVRAGQALAVIDAPELEEQVRQSRANLQQARAALEQALANLQQGKSELQLAELTAGRWKNLLAKGAVSRQENDQVQLQHQAKIASVQALDKATLVQRSNIAATEANVARLERMQSYLVVRAPFDGVITMRNVDVGALVNSGSTLLFRIAQTGTLRTYINVPQNYAGSVRPGQVASISVSNIPGREFPGKVAHTATSLDPASRTLLVEVHVPNADGALLPGMYGQVTIGSARNNPPLLIPSDALIVRADGAQVAIVREDHTIHLQKIEVARDYGDRLEVLSGLRQGEAVAVNPGDVAREGLTVDPVELSRSR